MSGKGPVRHQNTLFKICVYRGKGGATEFKVSAVKKRSFNLLFDCCNLNEGQEGVNVSDSMKRGGGELCK